MKIRAGEVNGTPKRVFNPTGATMQEHWGDSPDAKSRRLRAVHFVIS